MLCARQELVLTNLINKAGQPGQFVLPAKAEAFRARLKQLLDQKGLSPEMS